MHGDPPFVAIKPRTRRLGHDVVHFSEVSSTMETGRERAKSGAGEGLVIVADRQSAGVGRRGRPWESLGASLYATLLLRPQIPASELTLLPFAAGVALIHATDQLLRVPLRLKWPNDVMHGQRKLAGILVESVIAGGDVPEFVLVGLGVNGDVRQGDFPPELHTTASSLSIASGRHVCLPALLKLFLERFEPRYDALVAREPTRVWAEAKNFMATLGRRVRVQVAEGTIEGEAIDLGPEGELLVRDGRTVHAVRSGECEELRTV